MIATHVRHDMTLMILLIDKKMIVVHVRHAMTLMILLIDTCDRGTRAALISAPHFFHAVQNNKQQQAEHM